MFTRTRDARPPARGAPQSNHNLCADTYREEDAHTNCDLAPPPADLLDQAEVAAQQLAGALEVDALPPRDAIEARLKILHTVAVLLREGRPAPEPQEICDTCFTALRPSECVRCDACATKHRAEVA